MSETVTQNASQAIYVARLALTIGTELHGNTEAHRALDELLRIIGEQEELIGRMIEPASPPALTLTDRQLADIIRGLHEQAWPHTQKVVQLCTGEGAQPYDPVAAKYHNDQAQRFHDTVEIIRTAVER